MKWIIHILVLVVLFFSFSQISFGGYEDKVTEDIAHKILIICKDKNISIERLESFLFTYIKKRGYSNKVKKILQQGFSSAKKIKKSSEIKDTKEDLNYKDYLLFPYYKDIYLPSKSQSLIKRNIFKIKTTQKKIYLTFDDGPYNKATLDYFKKNNIAATFFLICNRINSKNIKNYKDTLFSIGAHTLSHRNYDSMNKEELSEDINRCISIFKQNNIKLDKFRPAFGVINTHELNILDKNGIKNYLWTIDSLDWNGNFSHTWADKMAKKASGGDIVLFHENVNLNDLDYFIKLLEKRGFSFGKL